MGYLKGFIHGAAIGTAVGICVAPQPGRKTREQVSSFAGSASGAAAKAQDAARQAAPFVQSAASTVVGAASSVKDKVTGGDDPAIAVKGQVTVRTDSGNGSASTSR
ncbi:MAG: YtxH domain-containing protein [Candidatus Dormibacteria bacterium]